MSGTIKADSGARRSDIVALLDRLKYVQAAAGRVEALIYLRCSEGDAGLAQQLSMDALAAVVRIQSAERAIRLALGIGEREAAPSPKESTR